MALVRQSANGSPQRKRRASFSPENLSRLAEKDASSFSRLEKDAFGSFPRTSYLIAVISSHEVPFRVHPCFGGGADDPDWCYG